MDNSVIKSGPITRTLGCQFLFFFTIIVIAIKTMSTDNYWDGSGWVTEPVWLLATGTHEWSYNSSSIPGTSGTQYNIYTRAMDNATNIENPCSNLFIFETDKPSSIIDKPLHNSWVTNLDIISGTSIDVGGSAIKTVEITIKQTDNDYYWDGIDWVSS